MATLPNNVYQFPYQPESQAEPVVASVQDTLESYPPLRALEPLPTMPEIIPSSPEHHGEPFRPDLERAQRVESYREIAKERDRQENKGFFKLGWRRKELTDTDIIDGIEQTLAYAWLNPKTGLLEETNKRFWLGGKGEVASRGDTVEVAHYYYRETQYLPNFTTNEIIIHYEVRVDSITKWVNGIPYPLSVEEIENFEEVTARYEERVRERLSPVDSNLHDLQEEIQAEQEAHEQIIAASSQEVMFSKAAIDRMVAEYKARQASTSDVEQSIQDEEFRRAA